jgi:hypothetical protein
MVLAFMVGPAYPGVRARARAGAAWLLILLLAIAACASNAPSARQRAALLVSKGRDREARSCCVTTCVNTRDRSWSAGC